MTKDISQDPISTANASGFPLQIATAHAVNGSHNWRVIFEEHPWRLEDTDQEGYIDIVARDRDNIKAIVIECKRVRQSAWVFLIPDNLPKCRSIGSIWFSWLAKSIYTIFGWQDSQIYPVSYQSQYCAIPGQEHGRKNLIERVASELLDSIEAFANQERTLEQLKRTVQCARIYIPIIVTTAQLYISYFDPSTISIQDGSLPKGHPYEEVPFVRFRKSLSVVENALVDSAEDIHRMSERTIFIVNAEKLQSFLNNFELDFQMPIR